MSSTWSSLKTPPPPPSLSSSPPSVAVVVSWIASAAGVAAAGVAAVSAVGGATFPHAVATRGCGAVLVAQAVCWGFSAAATVVGGGAVDRFTSASFLGIVGLCRPTGSSRLGVFSGVS